jgi:hypothetical protein
MTAGEIRSFWKKDCIAGSWINPLTPELNPSAQRYLTKFLLGILFLEPCIYLIMRENKQTQQLFIQFINYVW